MRKFLVLSGCVLLVAALGAGAWWAWPILFPSLPSGWLSTLAKADAALVQNRPDLARKALDPPPKALPVSGWLQWEKRVNAVALQTQAWPWAAQTAAAAQAQYPGNADLTAYLVWTLLQSRQPAQAVVWADKVLAGTSWDSLRTQAKIEAQGMAGGDWSEFRQTLSEPSSAAFSLYQRLASLDRQPEIRKNALLSALAEGRLDDARDHLGVLTPAQRDLPPFDRLQGLMAYDAGDWNRAAALLKSLGHSQPETLLVLADVYLHLGDKDQARIIYDQLLADRPETIPQALGVNRATLALEQNDPGAALELLKKVAAQNPSDPDGKTRLLVLEARFRLGEVDAVRTELDKLADEGKESTVGLEAELLKGRLFPEWSSVPRLWSLLHRHPEFPPLAERLAWLLLVSQDYAGAHRVLDLHEAALAKAGQPSEWWSHWLRALLFAAEDRLDEASAAFDSVPAAWRDSTFYADWSLTSLVRAQQSDPEKRKPLLDDALERLSRALDLLPPGTDPSALHRRSLWLTRRGELQTSLLPLTNPAQRGALRAAAAEDLRQAVQLDPDNFRASFLLRQALATKQDKP
jgi:hypothetical protein